MSEPEGQPTAAASEAQRRAWQRDRFRDAARLLPVLGLAAFVLPDLVLSGSEAAAGATRPWLVYLFAGWAGLIALAVWIARRAVSDDDGEGSAQ